MSGLTELASVWDPEETAEYREITGAVNPQLTARGRAPDLTGIGER